MLTTAPRLTIRRPSPTTAEFIVSTKPEATAARRAALCLVHAARIVLALSALALLYAQWTLWFGSDEAQRGMTTTTTTTTTPPSNDVDGVHADGNAWPGVRFLAQTARRLLHETRAGRAALGAATAAPAWALGPAAAVALWASVRRVHAEERLLVLRGLGVQTRSTRATLLGGAAATRFIPTEKIRDVLINEAFWGFGVRYVLVVVVEGEEELVVVFPRLLPRRDVVERVWRGVRGCLFEEGAKGFRGQENPPAM